MDLFENEVDDSCSISNLTMNLFSIAYLAVAKKVKFYYTHVLLCCYVFKLHLALKTAFYLEMREGSLETFWLLSKKV